MATIPTETKALPKIAQLIDADDLWVRNISQMVLLLTVADRAGRPTSEIIPHTPHPIHLSNMIMRQDLAQCRDVFKFIQSGSLEVVHPEDAASYYKKNPNAIAAVRRAYEKLNNQNSPVSREALAAVDPSTKSEDDGEVSVKSRDVTNESGSKVDTGGVNLKVRGIIGNVRNGSTKSDDAILDLENVSMTEPDLLYIVRETDGAVREWAKTSLVAMRSA